MSAASSSSERGNAARIAKLSRQCARIVLELRREGDAAGAARFEAAAIEAVDLVRRGRL